ncbi:MAG TPA: FlgD immunoglobulin-like domain containing protein [Candidatus Eisenbacteria bacterium]|nr:FlgD immunoglobulin-like domain containing protein [Candidatus Eisenbacteria bacterium]
MTFGFRLSLRFASLLILICCSIPALAAQRRVMIEELTSQTCGPCYSANPGVNTMIAGYGSQVASVKWHVWWPTPGDDWFYLINNAVTQNRVLTVYPSASHAAPSLYIDGGPATFIGSNEVAQINSRLLIPSPLTITGTAVRQPTVVNVSLDINVETATPAPPGGSNRLFVALVEKHVTSGATYTGTIAFGSNIVTGISGTQYLLKGSIVCGAAGLPACPGPQSSTPARVFSIDSPTQISLNRTASQDGLRTLEFKSYNWETQHHDVYRTINNAATPSATGQPIDMSATGPQHFDVALSLPPQPFPTEWVPEEFAIVAWVQGITSAGSSTEIHQTTEIATTDDVTGVDPQQPLTAWLGRSWPNPFTQDASIPFAIEREGHVDLAIYDVSGRLVRQIVSGQRIVGTYTEHWDGRDNDGARASNGVYYYRLRIGGADITRRMVLVH